MRASTRHPTRSHNGHTHTHTVYAVIIISALASSSAQAHAGAHQYVCNRIPVQALGSYNNTIKFKVQQDGNDKQPYHVSPTCECMCACVCVYARICIYIMCTHMCSRGHHPFADSNVTRQALLLARWRRLACVRNANVLRFIQRCVHKALRYGTHTHIHYNLFV